jgi:histone acetyltransferase (RNA polymerase elongator complex component)
MRDEVLSASKRGHTATDAERACRLIKYAGYSLIGQMMIGLPGSRPEDEIYTAQKICEMGADGARIYPTVTFFGTELACMAGRGEYRMLELDDAIERSKEVLKIFEERGVECIRIGLCASDNLGDLTHVMGGANHPALGELVRSHLYYQNLRKLLSGALSPVQQVYIPARELSVAIGQHKLNLLRLQAEFGAQLKFVASDCQTPKI